jgi:hypothetical protein
MRRMDGPLALNLPKSIVFSGAAAHTAGQAIDTNPWPAGSQENAQWASGWIAARVRASDPPLPPLGPEKRQQVRTSADGLWDDAARSSAREEKD